MSRRAGPRSRPTVVALTPVRDEAWILPRFLAATALWADHIIIADQGSDDGSRAIAAAHPKVTLIANPSREFSEVDRQRLLIDAARRIPGPRLLVALDADELLSANVLRSREWEMALLAPPGTAIELAKVELHGSIATYVVHTFDDLGECFPFGYVDDGAAHESERFHARRLPTPVGERRRLRLKETVVLHYQLLNEARQASKDRWYKCFERVLEPTRSVVEIERRYNWLQRADLDACRRAVDEEWWRAYRSAGVEVTRIDEPRTAFWWDWDVLRLFARHGVAPFRHLDVWRFDWEGLRRSGLAAGVSGLPSQPVVAPMGVRDRGLRAAVRASHRLHPRRVFDPLLAALTR